MGFRYVQGGPKQDDQDVREFSSAVELFKGDAARMARYVLGTSAYVDDVVIETFSTVWRKWHSRPGADLTKTWIVTIAFNLARNQLRSEAARRRNEISSGDPGNWNANQAPESPRIERLRQCLAALEKDELEIVLLTYFEAIPRPKVAELLAISEGALSMKLSRIRRKLRHHIERIEEYEK